MDPAPLRAASVSMRSAAVLNGKKKKKAHTQHVQDYLYWNLPTVLWGFLPALESEVPGIIILMYVGIRMFIQNNKCYYQYRAVRKESEGRSIEVPTSSYFLSIWDFIYFTFILFTYQPLAVSLFGFVFLHCFHNRKIKISYQIIKKKMLQQQHALLLLCLLHQTLLCSHRLWREEGRGLASRA